MSLISILMVLVSAGIHIGWNSLTKSSGNPRIFSLYKGTILVAIALIVPFSVDLTLIPATLWILILVSGIIHFFYIFALSTAYEKGDISFVYPIVRSAPAFVPVVAFVVFAERVSLRGGSGIAIVVFCIFALLLYGKIEKGRSLWRVFFRFENTWAFITLAMVVTYSVLDKAGMLRMRELETVPWQLQGIVYFLLENTLCYLIYWLMILLVRNKEDLSLNLWKNEWLKILLAALGTMFSYALILHVMKSENLSYIVTLRQSSILFAVLVGWIIFHEPYFRVRLLIALLMILGLALTAMG